MIADSRGNWSTTGPPTTIPHGWANCDSTTSTSWEWVDDTPEEPDQEIDDPPPSWLVWLRKVLRVRRIMKTTSASHPRRSRTRRRRKTPTAVRSKIIPT